MKGIIAQIDEHFENTKNQKPLSFKELIKLLEESSKRYKKIEIENEKSRKENIAHLQKRSKELGKPIPLELLAKILSYPVPMIGTDFRNKYIEWLT